MYIPPQFKMIKSGIISHLIKNMPVVCAVLFLTMHAHAAVPNKILIDLGPVAGTQPEDDGLYWNILTSSINSSLGQGTVTDQSGTVLGSVSITVTSDTEAAFDNSADLVNGTQYPDSVAKDGFMAYGSGNTSGADSVTLTVSGLDPNVPLDITFYGATPYTSYSRHSRYRVNGTNDAFLDNAKNKFHTSVLYSIYPTAEGIVSIELDAFKSNGFETRNAYLNAIEITINPPEDMFVDWRETALPGADFKPNQRVGYADPDGDGLCNLIEYFLGSDPKARNTFVEMQVIGTPPNRRIAYEYTRYKNTQASIQYEVSNDLENWSVAALTPEIINADLDGNGLREKVRVSLSADGSEGKYIRFRVEDSTISRQLSYPYFKIACVGDSITYGTGLADRHTESYPAQLGQQLSFNYEVENYGISGSTMLKDGDKPYWNQWAFGGTKSYLPDIIIIKLGTNDSKPWNWDSKANYIPNYRSMIDEFKAVSSAPTILVALPCPTYSSNFSINGSVIMNEMLPMLKQMIADDNLMHIDFFEAMSNKPQYFPDGIHPNAAGYTLMAATARTIVEKASHVRISWIDSSKN